MITFLTIVAIAIIPIALTVALLALIAGFVGSLAERDLGVGLFAERDA